MRLFPRATFVALVFSGSITGFVLAQVPPPTRPVGTAAPAASPAKVGTKIAVIDLKRVFDNHIQFKSTMDGIKKDYDAFETSMRDLDTTMRKQVEQLKTMEAGSVEYKQLETQLAQTRTNAQLDIQRKQKDRVDEEARVYHNTFGAIEKSVTRVCEYYGIDLVLQFTAMEIDPAKPDSVINGLRRSVIYQRNLDITDIVLQDLNRNAPAPPAQPIATPGTGGLRQPSLGNRTGLPPTTKR